MVDSCDANGNYYCESKQTCGAARCPTGGDLLSYTAIDATTDAATLENQTDHRRYLCQLTFDAPSDNYDCKTGPTEGLQVRMIAQGLESSSCTGGDFGGPGVGAATAALTDAPTCDYECVLHRVTRKKLSAPAQQTTSSNGAFTPIGDRACFTG